MKNVKTIINGVAQLTIGTVGLANDICLKTPAVVLNETSNFLSASLKLSSDRIKKATVKPDMETKTYGQYVRDEHKADAKRQRYINGSIPIEEIFADFKMPDFVKDVMSKQQPVAVDIVDVKS